MSNENPRIEELRRRVQLDPASIAFAQLAEECRRSGSYEEAVEICRNGLASHPDYLSARVTLGRALIELGSLDEAKHELDLVIATAPENLPAIRGLAEIFQRKGNLNESLAYFRRALLLAKHDVELEENVDRISQRIELPIAPPVPTPAAPVSVEDLFDFDKLLLELGEDPKTFDAPPAAAVIAPPVVMPETTAAPPLPNDEFAEMERELRAKEEQRARDEEVARARLLEEIRAREEQERLAREEQERLAREEEELLARLAREEEELLAREEQQRLALEEQERVARDRAEAELLARLAQEEEELRAREEEQARAREEEQRNELARQREEFEAQRRRDEDQRRRDEADRLRAAEEARQAAEQQRQLEALAELEHWLDAIVSDRDHHASL